MEKEKEVYHKAKIRFIEGNMLKTMTVLLARKMDESEVKRIFQTAFESRYVRKIELFDSPNEGRCYIRLI